MTAQIPKPKPFTPTEIIQLDALLSASIKYANAEVADVFRIARERIQNLQAYLLCTQPQQTQL